MRSLRRHGGHAPRTALPGGQLVYNSRTDGAFGPLFDPTAILYVRTSDLDSRPASSSRAVPVEPLILRARAGECIKLTLRNALPDAARSISTATTPCR